MMTPEIVAFWKRIGIVCTGITVTGALLSFLIGFAWREGTKPMVAVLEQQSAAIDRLQRRQFLTISALLDENPGRARRVLRDEMRKEIDR